MKRAALGAVLLFGLCSCGPTKSAQLAQCQLDTDRVFPHGDDIDRREHMSSCMAAKNYEWAMFVGKTAQMCAPDIGLTFYEADCYHPVSAWKRLTDH